VFGINERKYPHDHANVAHLISELLTASFVADKDAWEETETK